MQPFESISSCLRYLESALERRGFLVHEPPPKARKPAKERTLAQRITREDAVDIKALRAQGVSVSLIAERYGHGKGTISKICNNKYKPLNTQA